MVFGKDDARQITAMFSTEQDAKALATHLVQFAQSQSVLVAPGSAADQARMAALHGGEQALREPDASAAQLQQQRHVAAALSSAPTLAVHCTQCGTLAAAGARFCSKCGAALSPPVTP